MPRIAVDMDEVIADFIPKFLREFNQRSGESLTVKDLTGAHLRDLRPERAGELRALIREPSFFRDLAPMEHSQAVLRRLAERHEIFISTAAMEVPSSFTAKYDWLREHFAFISELHYVFCGDKSILHADYLIDDNVRHFQRFAGRGLLYSAPHNFHVTGYDRVSSWLEVEAYFAEKTGAA